MLRRECDSLGERLRILDVGGGDGLDAVPLAALGHDVTVLDPSAAWLAEARRHAAEAGVDVATVVGGLDDLPDGTWDLVLCHFVLRYRPAGPGDVEALAALVRPGGRLSLMDVNPAGRVLRKLVSEGPAAASVELVADRLETVTFGTDTRKVEIDDAVAEAQDAGLDVRALYGHRIANHLLVDDEAKRDQEYFEQLLSLERDLSGRAPFNRIGMAWQLLLERP
nr:class I SAM-dependent methyltransferase [Nocardioides sp. GY 10113]